MLYILLILLLVGLDQYSKYYVANHFILSQPYGLIDGILNITYVKNAGAAFGVLQNYQTLFILATIAILCILAIYFFSSSDKDVMLRLSLSLILAGGLGNLIDRIKLGYVVDFIDIIVWPVFNLSDTLVVMGCVLLTYYILFRYK